jgi:hypothetical protein
MDRKGGKVCPVRSALSGNALTHPPTCHYLMIKGCGMLPLGPDAGVSGHFREAVRVTELVNKPIGQLSFRDLVEAPTFVVDESQLEKDKERLIGVPFVITRVTFRPGESAPDYVSCEAIIGDLQSLAEAVGRGWIPGVTDVQNLPFAPEEHIVFNDSSTGVRRKIVEMLHFAGMINVGEATDEFDDAYRKPWQEWQSFSQVGQMNGEDGEKIDIPDFTKSPSGEQFAIVARHGLRVSNFSGVVDGKKVTADIYYLS